MSARIAATAFVLGLLGATLVSSCAVKLTDPTDPLPNGGVTGPPADCSTIQILPKGTPGTGATDPKLVGRIDMTDPKTPAFDWSGTEISTRFQGTTITV